MHSPTTTPAKRSSTKKKPASAPRQSASKRASRIAKRGEPLSAESPRDRSPKQENL